MNPEDKNLQLLADMLEKLDTKSSMEEMVRGFEVIIEFVKQTRDLTEGEVTELRTMFNNATHEIKLNNTEQFSVLKSRLLSDCEKWYEKMAKELTKRCDELEETIPEEVDLSIIEDKIKEVEKKILPQIIETPIETRDKLESIETESEKLKIEAIRDLRKELDEIKKMTGNRVTMFGGRMGGSVGFHDLSSQTNGVLKVFSVPKGLAGVLFSSDFPTVLMEGNGFSLNGSRTQLTLSASLNAPSEGSQLLYQFVKQFN